ncbi:hypothetical protein EAE96_010901 [Botrytis aclada]|nr:hypothetical protein EAE96_010901 [Botrytis aclada]
MEFLHEYKEVLIIYGNRGQKAPAIDVAFKIYLDDHPELPHPPNYELPTSAHGAGTLKVKVEADIPQLSGNSSSSNHISGWMPPNIPFRQQSPPVTSSMGKQLAKSLPLSNRFVRLPSPQPWVKHLVTNGCSTW